MTPGPFGYKSRAFTSVLNESVCVTMAVSAPTCMGTNGEVMSETYSPAYDPASITANWIGTLATPRRAPTRSSFRRVQGSRRWPTRSTPLPAAAG